MEPDRGTNTRATRALHPPRRKKAASSRERGAATLQQRLAKIGIHRTADFLLHLPIRYEDRTRICPLTALIPGKAWQIEATVVATEIHYRPRRTLLCQLEEGMGKIVLRFLYFYPSQVKSLAVGKRVRAYGEVREGFFGLEIVHPSYRVIEPGTPLPDRLTPVYPTTAGISQEVLREMVQRALDEEVAKLEDTLPREVRAAARLIDYQTAIHYLHRPPVDASMKALEERTHPAWRRLKFDELLAQQLSMKRYRRQRQSRKAPRLSGDGQLRRALLSRLPFTMTQAQQRASTEIAHDLASSRPMHRLLQGDVGSGKTVVAALAALQTIESGYQAAFMAPTEILAEQHFRKLSSWLASLGLRIEWLTGGMNERERKSVREACAKGTVNLVIGTHALFQKEIALPKLGFVIVDEQHRFGVAQRLALRDKGAQHKGKRTSARGVSNELIEPHLLMMSATPIPRSLAMSYYADLDVSVLDEMPRGRGPIVTKLVSERRRSEVIDRVRQNALASEQTFWVCPLIEESEKLQLQTAEETFTSLQSALSELRIGLLHGRMKSPAKAAVMEAFARGELNALVATTVVEVGVDIPNATLIVIENAERYGLAQLHQLRGRVGRGEGEGACVLLYGEPLSPAAKARLKVIYENQDGFKIAREDLRIRGPGELLGARQSGVPLLRFADLEQDVDLLELARSVADRLLAREPQAVERHLARWMGARQEFMKA